MLADQDRDALVAMMIQQWQHISMPQSEDDRPFVAPKDGDVPVVDETYPPATTKRSHKRNTEPHRPTQRAFAPLIGATRRARCSVDRSRARFGQLAALWASGAASSSAIAATRRAAPGVPSESLTRSSSITIRARWALRRSRSGASASATALGSSAPWTNSGATSFPATTFTSPICGIFTRRRAAAYVTAFVR